MKLVLFLMLAIAANSAWARVESSPAPVPKAEQLSTAVSFELLPATAVSSGAHCGANAHPVLWSLATRANGASDAYCAKMAQCCESGVASCCANYNKYCNY
jgi:hypothetical protein